MTAKEYLRQLYITDRNIKRLEGLRKQLRDEMYSLKSPTGSMSPDKVQTSMTGDAIERLIAKVDEAERDILRELDKQHEIRKRIVREIEAVPNEQQRDILFRRYVLFDKWERIAVDMDVSIRYVYMLHGKALKAFEKIKKL